MEPSTKYNPAIHHRRSIRLKEYDYSQAGAYFVTICTHDRQCRFGNVLDGEMVLNELGAIAREQWICLPERFHNVVFDEFVVMPNHMHGIILINESNVGAGFTPAHWQNIARLSRRGVRPDALAKYIWLFPFTFQH